MKESGIFQVFAKQIFFRENEMNRLFIKRRKPVLDDLKGGGGCCCIERATLDAIVLSPDNHFLASISFSFKMLSRTKSTPECMSSISGGGGVTMTNY